MTKQKFKDLLWTVYFTDEMEKSFPTPKVKGMAFSAMVYLWKAKELEVCEGLSLVMRSGTYCLKNYHHVSSSMQSKDL